MRLAPLLLVLAGCGSGSGVLDMVGTSVCASGLIWNGGNSGSALMNPGHACIACHTTGKKGPTFAVAGTVYGKPGEVDGCAGVATGMKIEITGADGTLHALTPNAAGNFFLEGVTVKTPYRARLVHPDGVREMAAAQTNGDCNACHSTAGLEGAPGRISPP